MYGSGQKRYIPLCMIWQKCNVNQMEGDDGNSMYSIMIIDDDESIGNMEQELLELEEYQVQRAFSGTEALLLLKQQI